jgi:predicted nucleotide-binding protein
LSIEFLESDFDKVSYLVNLLTSKATGLGSDSREFELLRRELLSNPNVSPFLPQWLKQHRNLDTFWGFIKQKFGTYSERRTYLSEEFTSVLDMLELGQPAQPTSQVRSFQNVSPSKPKVVARNKRKVFIVHGRDNEAKQEVSRFIEKLGLEVIILHEQASSGMTIIEKIEYYSNDADFALVLYTSCDQGRGAHESNVSPKKRARQNVVFEHGYLMAKLGRENVCSLVKGEIETPNDLSGVVYVTLDPFAAWKTEVAKELKACGYAINSII